MRLFVCACVWICSSSRLQLFHIVFNPHLLGTSTNTAELQDILDGCLCDGKDSWEMLPNGRSVHPAPKEVLDAAVEDAMARRGGAAGDGIDSYLDSVWLRARDIGCQGALMEKYDDHFDLPQP